MATQIRTPDGIVIFDKYIFEGQIDTEKPVDKQYPRYSIQLAFPPTTDLSEVEAAAKAAFTAKFPTDKFNATASPLKPYSGQRDEMEGWTQINFSSNKPLNVVDRRGRPIDPGAGGIYSGCKAAAIGYAKASGGQNGWAKRASFVCTAVQLIEQLDPHFQNHDPSGLILDLDEPGTEAMSDLADSPF